MFKKNKILWLYFPLLLSFLFIGTASAHCDSMEGPVVKASQKALETGNIDYVLIWVRESDEKEIKDVFAKVNKVRTLSPEARELADMYFYETIVRVHRNGEGVGYTGLKPIGYKPEAGIEAADLAIEKNDVNEVLQHLDSSKHPDVLKYFDDVQSKKSFNENDVNAGRSYVASYVHFIHFIEKLFTGDIPNDDNVHENHHN